MIIVGLLLTLLMVAALAAAILMAGWALGQLVLLALEIATELIHGIVDGLRRRP